MIFQPLPTAPCISVPSLLRKPYGKTARAVALVVRKAGGVDAEHGVIAADDLRNVRAVVAEALAGADIDVFRLFAERELACIFQSERVLARLFDDKDAMLYIERQHRVTLPGLEAGVVALRGRVIDEIELKALVALFLDVRIFVEEALELGLVQLAVQLIESGLRTDGLLLAVRVEREVPEALVRPASGSSDSAWP